MKSWFVRAGALIGAAIFLTACGGSSTSGAAATSDLAPSTAAEVETAAPVTAAQDGESSESSESSDASGEPKTLDDYLGLAANVVRGGGGRGGNFDQDEALEQQRLVQQEIQVCMQAQGFTYVPEDVGTGLRFFLATENSGQSPAEYAELEGFGISTRFDALLESDVDLSESSSPNDEHLATLGEGEADAWQFALRGAPPERNEQGQLIDPETGEVIQGRGQGATGGCQRDAQESVRGDFSALAELASDFDELEERIAADPRIAEIARNWTDCMGAAGFDYQDEAEAREEINSEFRPLIRTFFRSANSGTEQGQGQDQGQGQGGGNRLQAIAGLELTPEQDAELEVLQDRERAIAVASFNCQSDSTEEVAQIEAAYEAEFIETNRAALEALSS